MGRPEDPVGLARDEERVLGFAERLLPIVGWPPKYQKSWLPATRSPR